MGSLRDRRSTFHHLVYSSHSKEHYSSFRNVPMNRNRTMLLDYTAFIKLPHKGYSTFVRDGYELEIAVSSNAHICIDVNSPFKSADIARFRVRSIRHDSTFQWEPSLISYLDREQELFFCSLTTRLETKRI